MRQFCRLQLRLAYICHLGNPLSQPAQIVRIWEDGHRGAPILLRKLRAAGVRWLAGRGAERLKECVALRLRDKVVHEENERVLVYKLDAGEGCVNVVEAALFVVAREREIGVDGA